jgi:hypothetical protein
VTPGRVNVKWLLLGVAIATTIVFVVIRILASGQAADNTGIVADVASETAEVSATRNAAPSMAAPSIAAPSIAAPSIVAARDAAPNPPSAAATDIAPADAKTEARIAQKNAAPKGAGRKVAGKVEVATGASPEPSPAPKVERVAAASRNAPARVAEAPRDPWQAMNEGLSRCARENFFNRIACEQRLRLQYCPNYWGLVPQCAIGAATDHGQ